MLPVRCYAAVPHVQTLAGVWANVGRGMHNATPWVTEELRLAYPPRAFPTLQEAASESRRRRGKRLVLPRQKRRATPVSGSPDIPMTVHHQLEDSADDGDSIVGQYECLELAVHFEGDRNPVPPQPSVPLDPYIGEALDKLMLEEPFAEVLGGRPESYGCNLWIGSLVVWVCVPYAPSRSADDTVAALSLLVPAAGASRGDPEILQEAGCALARSLQAAEHHRAKLSMSRTLPIEDVSSPCTQPATAHTPRRKTRPKKQPTPRTFLDYDELIAAMQAAFSDSSGKLTFTGLANLVNTRLGVASCHASGVYRRAWEALVLDPKYKDQLNPKRLIRKRSLEDGGPESEEVD